MWLLYLNLAVELAVLATAGYSDVVSREVDDRVWLAGAAVLAPMLVYELYVGLVDVRVYAVSAVVGLLYAGLIWVLGAVGEADVIALAFVAVFTPQTVFTPCVSASLAVILDSVPFVALYALYNLAWNARRGAGFEGYVAGRLARLYALLSMRYISAEEYREKQYMYAPGYVVEGGRRVIRVHLGAGGEEGEGFEGGWAIVYAPYVAVLAAGFAVYVALVALGCGGCPLSFFLRAR